MPNQSIVSKISALIDALSDSEGNRFDSQAGLCELMLRKQRGYKLPEAITHYRFNGNCRHHHMMAWLTNFMSYYPSCNFEKKVRHSVSMKGKFAALLLNFSQV